MYTKKKKTKKKKKTIVDLKQSLPTPTHHGHKNEVNN